MDSIDWSNFDDRSLIVVEDDQSFLNRLSRALETRGFEVKTAASVAEGINLIKNFRPATLEQLLHLRVREIFFFGL